MPNIRSEKCEAGRKTPRVTNKTEKKKNPGTKSKKKKGNLKKTLHPTHKREQKLTKMQIAWWTKQQKEQEERPPCSAPGEFWEGAGLKL